MKVKFISGLELEIDDAGKDKDVLLSKFRQSGHKHAFLREHNMIVSLDNIAVLDLEDHKAKTVADFEAEKKEIELLREKKRQDKMDKLARSEEKIKEEALKKMEADFMARANCKHKAKDGTTLRSMYYTDTMQGRKFFPVCEFCGHRERYIGKKKIVEGKTDWTLDDIENAKPYEG